MRKKVFLFTIGLLANFCVNSQTTFQKAFGGTEMDEGNSVRQTTDGGYVIAGTTTSFGAGGRDVLVIKTNSLGDTVWTKIYGDSIGNEYGYCVQQTSDGGYIISGSSQNFFTGEEDMYLLKLKANGDTLWTRTYGGIGLESGYFVQQTTDGGYVTIGQTPSFGSGGFDAYLVKINSNGAIAWTKTYGGIGSEYGTAVQQTSDNGYIITGSNDHTFGFGSSDFYLIKTDEFGNHIWSKAYGDVGYEEGKAVLQTADGGYVIAGTSENDIGPLGPNMCLIKTNNIGDTLWAKLYGGEMIDECFDVKQTSDGGYIMVGKSFSFSVNGDYDVYVVKVNSQGDLKWSKTYGGNALNHNEVGYSIAQTNDGGYIISGESQYGFGIGIKNIYLVKTDSLGNSGCNQDTPLTEVATYLPQVITTPTLVGTGGDLFYPNTIANSGSTQTNICISEPISVHELNENRVFSINPNPFIETVSISNSETTKLNSIIIYDVLGNIVFTKILTDPTEIPNEIILDLNFLNIGIYFCELNYTNSSKKITLVKQ